MMLIVDFLILNRDRHGANIEVLRNSRKVNNYIGSRSTWENLGLIPKDKMPRLRGLKESDKAILLYGYDEFELLMLAQGRCAQDDCYLVLIQEDQLPKEVHQRFLKRVEDVEPPGLFLCG